MRDFSRATIIELAVAIAVHLQQHGIEVVLVGGLAVEVYSENLYLTKDIDMVNTNYQLPALAEAMSELGFHKQGRVFVNTTTEVTVEFPAAPLAVGDELVNDTTTVELPEGTIPILKAEDVVKDRIAAFVHWRDTQSLVQATAVMLKHDLEPEGFRDYVEREGERSHFPLLAALYERGKAQHQITMAQLEADLADLLLQNI